MAKKINSNLKGKVGERELSKLLTEKGFKAGRGKQFQGSPDSPDIKCDSLKELGFHIECKRTETLSLYPTIEQCKMDSPEELSLVCHRRSRKEWLAIMYLDELLFILKAYEQYRHEILTGGSAH